jgi:hypothetical protein
MENEDTEYIEGEGDDFSKFLFSCDPREKNSVKLELDPPKPGVKFGLHIFQELLMIFTTGMKYIYPNNQLLKLSILTDDDIEKLNKYFQSFGFNLIFEKFTIHDYLSNMKLPNYFKNHDIIKDDTMLKDIYYEPVVEGLIYRISFDFLK